MAFFILLAAMGVLILLTVMLVARKEGARRAGFGRTLLAVSLQAVLFYLTRVYVPGLAVPVIVAVLAGSVIYAIILGTSLIKGLQIGVLAAIMAAVGFLIIGRILSSGLISL